ncbi:MAG: hypothetical protein Q4C91_05825 [Eubacteriales bacterium]|nr:hypothetical protein [Eubacteriales bacterium]
MLKWQENYYVGEGIKNPEAIRRKIDQGKMAPGIYLLTLSPNPDNLMEILPAITLIQDAAYRLCPDIIGMARGKDEAIQLAADVLMEAYRRTGTFRVEEYLKNR